MFYTWHMDVAKIRLHNQHISGPKCKTAEDVVRTLGAVQAQDYNQALWAIGLRLKPDATVTDVERTLADRTIIRTWGMRGTLHFIVAEDAHWMRELLSANVLARMTPKVWQYHGADQKMVDLAKSVFVKALSSGKTLSRPAMLALLKQAGIPEDKQQSYFLLAYLSQTGLLCLGESKGGKQTFALLDEWVANPRKIAHTEALALLATRFFTSHGPATVADFANWSALKMPEAKTGLDVVKSKLIKENIDGKEYWLAPGSKPGNGVFLLPGYDEFVIGYKNRTAMFKQGVIPIATYNGMFYPTIVIDGQVVGLWKRIAKKSHLEIEIDPDAQVKPELVEPHAKQLGHFFGLPTRMRIGRETRMKPQPKPSWR